MQILVFYTMNESLNCFFYPVIESNRRENQTDEDFIQKEVERYEIINPQIKGLDYDIFDEKNLPEPKFKRYTRGTKEKKLWVDTDGYLNDLKETKIKELKEQTRTKILETYPLEKQNSISDLICYSEDDKKEMIAYISDAITDYRTKKEKILNAKYIVEIENIKSE